MNYAREAENTNSPRLLPVFASDVTKTTLEPAQVLPSVHTSATRAREPGAVEQREPLTARKKLGSGGAGRQGLSEASVLG